MEWDAVGAIGEMVGALAVVVSLGYVGVQIRQNTQATRDLAAQNLTAADAEVNYMLAGDAELARIVQDGVFDHQALNEYDQFRFNALFFALYSQYDFAYRRFKAGKLDPVSWQKMEYEIPLYLHLAGACRWWEQDKPRFTNEFVEFVDRSPFPLRYSFRHKGVLFVMLDAARPRLDAEQQRWLSEQLEVGKQASLRFVVGHIPLAPYTEESRGTLASPGALLDLLVRGREDLVRHVDRARVDEGLSVES